MGKNKDATKHLKEVSNDNRLIKKSIDAFGTEIISLNEGFGDVWKSIFKDVKKSHSMNENNSTPNLFSDSKYNKELSNLKRLYEKFKNNPHALKNEIKNDLNAYRSLFQTTIESNQYKIFLNSNSTQFKDLDEEFLDIINFFITGTFKKKDGEIVTLNPNELILLYDKISAHKMVIFVRSIIDFKKYLYTHANKE